MPASFVEIFIEQGANFSSDLYLTETSSNAAMNLDSTTFTANIKKSYHSANAQGAFNFQIIDASNGVVAMTLTALQTANIQAGRYVYTVQMKQNDEIRRPFEGHVIVLPKT